MSYTTAIATTSFSQQRIMANTGLLSLQCAPQQPKFAQRVNSVTSQVRQLNLNLQRTLNLCAQNGQCGSAEANVMAQVTNTMTQTHLQFSNFGAQLDAVHHAIQRRKMTKQKIALCRVSLSDCCSTPSSQDGGVSAGSRSPSVSSNASPCPSFSSATTIESDCYSLSSSDSLSTVSDISDSDFDSQTKNSRERPTVSVADDCASEQGDRNQEKLEEINVTTQARRKEVNGILRRQFRSFRSILAAQRANAAKSTPSK